MNFITVTELNNDILQGIHKIPRDVDLIVGIPRSGMLVASLIALYMNKPLTDIDSFVKGEFYSSGSTKNISNNKSTFNEIKKVIIVEDSSCTGKSVVEARKKVENIFTDVAKLYFAAYVTDKTKSMVDIWLRIVEDRVFEWNYMHHTLLKDACVDMDGILCVDPTEEENDDGERYREFIRNAKPKYIPTRKIGYIVTSRLEKYRGETETWLKKNGVEYGELIMLKNMTAEERRKSGSHGEYKAAVYKSISSARIFIESEPKQAETISKITNKDVFCPQGSIFYRESNYYYFYRNFKRKIFGFIHSAICRIPGCTWIKKICHR